MKLYYGRIKCQTRSQSSTQTRVKPGARSHKERSRVSGFFVLQNSCAGCPCGFREMELYWVPFTLGFTYLSQWLQFERVNIYGKSLNYPRSLWLVFVNSFFLPG
jgi:hypothetical protein